MNISFENIKKIGGWRLLDLESNLTLPWYTESFLRELSTWDIRNWRVFEYGGGDSTVWWRTYSKEVISVDTSEKWSNDFGLHHVSDKSEFLQFPIKFIEKEGFDCIIIDAEPVEWRDECTEYALKCLKSKGMLIIDNYKQDSVGLKNWKMTDKLLEKYQANIFSQDGHRDWKTSYWIKS